jgi:hypothetical protein
MYHWTGHSNNVFIVLLAGLLLCPLIWPFFLLKTLKNWHIFVYIVLCKVQ